MIELKEIKPSKSRVSKSQKTLSIFLAGSIEMGKAIDWQAEIFEFIKHSKIENSHIEEINVFNPRRDNWDPSWKQDINNPEFAVQVEWELENIEASDIVVFFLQPGTNSPISLLELGLVAKDSFAIKKHVIVYCPDGFHRKGNVDIVAQMFDMHTAKTMDDFKSKILTAITQFNPTIFLNT